MIFGNYKNLEDYDFLDSKIKKCFEFAKANDLLSFENGSYPIEGEDLFVNIVEFTTTNVESRFWEAHKKYLDFHQVLSGSEQIDLNFIENLKEESYTEKDDFVKLEGEKNSSVILRPGDFLICYPADGHRTAIALKEPSKVKKAIFKIRIN